MGGAAKVAKLAVDQRIEIVFGVFELPALPKAIASVMTASESLATEHCNWSGTRRAVLPCI